MQQVRCSRVLTAIGAGPGQLRRLGRVPGYKRYYLPNPITSVTPKPIYCLLGSRTLTDGRLTHTQTAELEVFANVTGGFHATPRDLVWRNTRDAILSSHLVLWSGTTGVMRQLQFCEWNSASHYFVKVWGTKESNLLFTCVTSRTGYLQDNLSQMLEVWIQISLQGQDQVRMGFAARTRHILSFNPNNQVWKSQSG